MSVWNPTPQEKTLIDWMMIGAGVLYCGIALALLDWTLFVIAAVCFACVVIALLWSYLFS